MPIDCLQNFLLKIQSTFQFADCNNGQSNENFNTNMRKRKCSSASSSSSDSKKPLTKIETDPLVLARRQKDIDYGKNTIGYDNYTKEVSK